MTDFEWHNAADFAEVAEAIGIETTLIVAAHRFKIKDKEAWTVIWSHIEDGNLANTMTYSTTLARDKDGILRRVMVDMEMPDLFSDMFDHIEAELRRKLGPPK